MDLLVRSRLGRSVKCSSACTSTKQRAARDEDNEEIVRAPSCRRRGYATSLARPLRLANGLLETAYSIRQQWDGTGDLAAAAKRKELMHMQNADTAAQWRSAADRFDILEGNHYWKFDETSDECDMELIRLRLDRLKKANHEGDTEEMLLQIRNALKRDLGGMCNVRLYQHSSVGTKHLIEEYTEVVKYTIERIATFCESADAPTVNRYLETMKSARQSFGSTALMLSGGGTLGMCHIGVVKCLLEQGLLPRVVCGSSAGSIVGSVLCTQKTSAIPAKLDELCRGDLSVFQGADEWRGVPGMAINILKGDPAFDVSNLCRVMRSLLGNITFKEAYNLTGMVLNIHVSCRDKHNLPRLLNYVTSPNVIIWSAVASSCSLPLVFEPPGLRAKHPETGNVESWGHSDHKWIDGSIEGDLPAQTLERLFNVNNFIASQVNPHVTAFLPQEGEVPSIVRRSLTVSQANLTYLLDNAMDRGWDSFPVKMAHAVLSQKYDGDVTILPDISWVPWLKVLANPNHEFMMRATREGELATWPKLDRIHNYVAIELSLEYGIRAIQTMQVAGMRPDGTRLRRIPSSTRSEHGLSHARRKSGGPGGLNIIPRPPRGRGSTLVHRSIKSMMEGPMLQPAHTTGQHIGDHILSSSDETHSGRSSPVTSYDEKDSHYDDDDEMSDMLEPTDHERKMLAFLSQPASPSISMKTYWGTDALRSRAPSSPEIKKAMGGLQMSSIMPDRKRSRH
ncbi:hypothetical protein DOTSEDRAFT_68076 [Dothistroma septosporum NZE10]|uniref:Patatin-like phospholipase domain-containing protein n=1 Tax=Dothistroma septosporum (strain NZE10 / CBS 128990) TaxID=675120 RepID=N1Q0B1_DOTSN|nr:hypothetical protein DOTSEDRAFT_68076 [Dothistroma septosporum NZE10]